MMRLTSTWLIALALASSYTTAIAEPGLDIDNVAALTGTCSRLMFAGKEVSASCTNKAIISALKNGRVVFSFFAGDIALVSFSGSSDRQVKDTVDASTQPIDRATFKLLGMGDEGKSNVLSAAGTCAYENPFGGHRAKVSCTAHTEKGLFAAEFMSDGTEPAIIQP